MGNKKPSILIIEDEAGFRRIYRDMLNSAGFRVDEAVSAKEGLEKAKALKPTLILLDIMLPDISGIEALKELKGTPETKDIPVAVLSVLSDQNDIQGAMDAGADQYIVKGSHTPSEVMQRLGSYLFNVS